MQLGTPLTSVATRALLLGSGELGKEITIELQRLGVEVIACDKYANAPAMQVAHRAHVFNMLDGDALRKVVEQEKPSLIIPEVEAIATRTLVELEQEGYRVIPTANAAFLTMNREAIRRLAAEELGLPTARYRFADTYEEFVQAVKEIGIPCVVKPIMSSSGHGQTTLKSDPPQPSLQREGDGEIHSPFVGGDGGGLIDRAWAESQKGGRAGAGRVIVEGFVDFDYEITLLTVRCAPSDKGLRTQDENSSDVENVETKVISPSSFILHPSSPAHTLFLEPVGHHQVDGDYRESWQPQAMSPVAKQKAQEIAKKITDALGGYGIFGVEMFVKGDEVIFSEVSPRPHDTGMVTMISQDLSEFALHARAVLGLPIPEVRFFGPSASKAIVVEGDTDKVVFSGLEKALSVPGVQLRLFGKPEVHGHRRFGVLLATADTIEHALEKVEDAYKGLDTLLTPPTEEGK
ncbi:MAG: phosphoribosylglycinamide formyltransferase 2 [Paludibacteraceae bacterium]|nr:phosphoribosylglycinamide formyltransferase 2 [Paludibacteraceae bacterium]